MAQNEGKWGGGSKGKVTKAMRTNWWRCKYEAWVKQIQHEMVYTISQTWHTRALKGPNYGRATEGQWPR